MRHTSNAVGVILSWYARHVYGRLEGPRRLPFYANPTRVGPFAVPPARLARGDEAAVFQVLATLTMYQSRRDVDIMAKQREMGRGQAAAMTQARRLRVLIEEHACARLMSADVFDAGCDVRRDFARGRATCGHRPRTPCHVKDATHAIARMGELGKLPTSAWLHLYGESGGGLNAEVVRLCKVEASSARRAELMVAYVARIFHVGEKLGAFYVSALATPALAPGFTPWFPALDGNHLLVVDANVRRVIETLRPRGAQTYAAHVVWLRRQAALLDLRTFRRSWPRHSPRLMQQAMYWYRSRANREMHGLACDGHRENCVPDVCPFHAR